MGRPLSIAGRCSILHDPRYAGAFVYGRNRTGIRPDGDNHLHEAATSWCIRQRSAVAYRRYRPVPDYDSAGVSRIEDSRTPNSSRLGC